MPDVIEPASSGRSKCRRCGEKIAKETLRFGERVPNPFGDGEATYWYHLQCAAEKRAEKVEPVLASFDGEIQNRAALEKAVSDARRNPKLSAVRTVERATSGRARCRHCREKIPKESLRVVLEREDEDFPSMASAGFIHLACAKEYLGTDGLADKLLRNSPSSDDDAREEISKLR